MVVLRLEDEVEAAFQAMTDSQKRVAQFVVRNPEEVAFHTLDELAARIDVSTTTVIRFARALGYRGYSDFQSKIQERVRARVGLPERLGLSSSSEDDVFTRAFERDLANIRSTMRSLSRGSLARAVDCIASARTVYVIGIRSSFCPAFFAGSVLSQILDDVRLLNHQMGMLPEQTLRMSEADVLIAFSFPRYSRVTIDVAKQAKKQGARVVAICDSPLSPVAQTADIVLPCAFEGVLFKNSPVAPLSLVNGLIAAVAVQAKERSMLTLSRGEELVKEWDYFLM